MEEVEIINLHKRRNKTETNAVAKAGTKTGGKANVKSPRSRYYLFLKEQASKMTGEDKTNDFSILLGM